MKFVKVKLIEGPDKTSDLPVNPMTIIAIVPISVKGKMLGPGGEPVMRRAAGLDCGFKIIPVDHTVEEAQAMLERRGQEGVNNVFNL